MKDLSWEIPITGVVAEEFECKTILLDRTSIMIGLKTGLVKKPVKLFFTIKICHE